MKEIFPDEPDEWITECVPSVGYVEWSRAAFEISTIIEGYEIRASGDKFENCFYGYEGQKFCWSQLEVIGNIYDNPELLAANA